MFLYSLADALNNHYGAALSRIVLMRTGKADLNVARKLIKSHLVTGEMVEGGEIGIRIDQTLTQDATGTMVMLELEAMNLKGPMTLRTSGCKGSCHRHFRMHFHRRRSTHSTIIWQW